MELYVNKINYGEFEEFFIDIKNSDASYFIDKNIAQLLDLSLENYRDILLKYQGYFDEFSEIYFKTYEDCERALNSEELLPKVIILKLLGE